MTDSELVKSVQAFFNDPTDTFADRVRNILPAAVNLFCGQHQWEFLDKYVTCTTAVSTQDASGKYRIVVADDMFKPVVLFTASREIEYVDRITWASKQSSTATSQSPSSYTVIGNELVLSYPPDSTTIYAVYTRKSDNVTLADMPAQYHAAVQMAVQWLLTPAYIDTGGHAYPNPALMECKALFREAITAALRSEASQKARQLKIHTAEIVAKRAEHD